MRPKLFVLVGISGSGKSTYAEKIVEKENAVIVSSDAIRGELLGDEGDQSQNERVFAEFHKRIRNLLEHKKNVIADATNITIKSRRTILKKINGLDVEKICYVIAKEFDQCILDATARDRTVPGEAVWLQLMRYQIPFMEEGWDEIQIIGGRNTTSHNYVLSMRQFDQKNSHHKFYLYGHCYNATMFFATKYPEYARYGLGASFHDLGKLFTQTIDEDGEAHYYQHHCVGSYHLLCWLVGSYIDSCVLDQCFLVNYHMQPFTWFHEKTKKKWESIFGTEKYNMLLAFHECDKRAATEEYKR